MAHVEQQKFCNAIKLLKPSAFKNVNVLDVGSLDINGNNRYLFEGGFYLGLDIVAGKNVDVVSPIVGFNSTRLFDTIISTEMLEHDKDWKASLGAMYALLVQGGFLLITCATTGRKEHGTSKNEPMTSPGTLDWYKNISLEEFEEALPRQWFSEYFLRKKGTDLQFYGVKI